MIYSIFELQDDIELLNKSILKQENDLQIAEVKFSLNMITKNDLDSTKSALETSRLHLTQYSHLVITTTMFYPTYYEITSSQL